MHSKIGQKFSIASAFIMKILYDFYISRAYSYARVKKNKKVKMYRSKRPQRPEIIHVSLTWSMPGRIATLQSTAVREFRANFPTFYRSLHHHGFASCFEHYSLLFKVIQKWNFNVESIKECFSRTKLNTEYSGNCNRIA